MSTFSNSPVARNLVALAVAFGFSGLIFAATLS